jgi:hypothetical protein
VVTSFHFLYSVVTISSVLPLTQTWPTPEQQVFWTSVVVSLNGVFLFDAYPGRRLVTALSGIGVLTMSAVIGLTYFGFYQVDLADVPLLGGQVSPRSRLLGSQGNLHNLLHPLQRANVSLPAPVRHDPGGRAVLRA